MERQLCPCSPRGPMVQQGSPAALEQAVAPWRTGWMELAPPLGEEPHRVRFTGSTWDPMGVSWSSLLLRTCTLWRGPAREEDYFTWLEPMLEQGKSMRKKEQLRHVRTNRNSQLPKLLCHSQEEVKNLGMKFSSERTERWDKDAFNLCFYFSLSRSL